jgi:three-Cys-motif partner protein
MAAPKTTLWDREPHTVGKHLVLKEYLGAWFPIITKRNGRVLFIDGFAGPGEYRGGEPGSPLIAIETLQRHKAIAGISAEVRFFFVEADEARKNHLDGVVARTVPGLPKVCKIKVIHGSFDETMTDLFDSLEAQKKAMAPAFVMVDPFGVKGTPMSVIQRIFANPRSEVYVSVMYESINRFGETEAFEPHLDELFGCQDWRKGFALADGEARKDFFYGLYADQLRKAGANHVVHFELFQRGRLVYAIFFGTQHVTGCDRMKQAIWKIAPWGDFAFRGSHNSQPTLGLAAPDYGPLKVALVGAFGGRGWVTIERVIEFVSSDRTDYHSSQVKTPVLVPMEVAGEIEVKDGTRNRVRSFPAGTVLRFK